MSRQFTFCEDKLHRIDCGCHEVAQATSYEEAFKLKIGHLTISGMVFQ